jgi:hypothetical protein
MAPVAIVNAQEQTSVSVVDNSPNHPPIPHSQQFNTTLTASVTNPPQTNTEETVTGPTWAWSVTKPSSGFGFAGPTLYATETLENTSLPLPAGDFVVDVTAVATYIETDTATGVQTPVSFTGYGTVLGFGIVPTGFTDTYQGHTIMTNEYFTTGVNAFGHETEYGLFCSSNEADIFYQWGSAVETLTGASYNPTYQQYIIANGGVGTGNSAPLDGGSGPMPGAVWDTNAMYDNKWGAPYGGTNTGASTFWASCTQGMSVNDVYPSTVLNSFTLTHTQHTCGRQ